MDREERLRRQRERDRARRLRETAEEREVRLARRREYERTRRSAMASQQRDAVLQQRRQRWSQNHDDPIEAIPLQSCDNDVVHLRNSSVDSPYITQKLKQFHEKLFKLEAALCVVCLERFLR